MTARWEYRTLTVPLDETLAQSAINELGQQGWEAFAVIHSFGGVIVYYLKRPVTGPGGNP